MEGGRDGQQLSTGLPAGSHRTFTLALRCVWVCSAQRPKDSTLVYGLSASHTARWPMTAAGRRPACPPTCDRPPAKMNHDQPCCSSARIRTRTLLVVASLPQSLNRDPTMHDDHYRSPPTLTHDHTPARGVEPKHNHQGAAGPSDYPLLDPTPVPPAADTICASHQASCARHT